MPKRGLPQDARWGDEGATNDLAQAYKPAGDVIEFSQARRTRSAAQQPVAPSDAPLQLPIEPRSRRASGAPATIAATPGARRSELPSQAEVYTSAPRRPSAQQINEFDPPSRSKRQSVQQQIDSFNPPAVEQPSRSKRASEQQAQSNPHEQGLGRLFTPEQAAYAQPAPQPQVNEFDPPSRSRRESAQQVAPFNELDSQQRPRRHSAEQIARPSGEQPSQPSRAHRPSETRRGTALAPGAQIGRYVLMDKLGQGSFGLVFTARDTVLDRAVAIKVLNPAHQYNPDVVRRFLQEALASARVVHPGVIVVHDYGTFPITENNETAYIVYELLQGESLIKRVERTGKFQVPWAIEIARQVSSALDASHRAGVLHRDLKSENIYLVPDPAAVNGERIKVLDFGLAKVGASQHTQMNTVFGTPRYMSPEQCRSATNIDERSDIYSLGCVLFELVTGRTPFVGELRQLLEGHQRVPAPRASSLNSEVPKPLDDLIDTMLAKDPKTRPQSMADVQQALFALNAAALAQPNNRAQVPMPVASVPVPVSSGIAATMLPTAASMLHISSPASTAHMPQMSPAQLAAQQVHFNIPAGLPRPHKPTPRVDPLPLQPQISQTNMPAMAQQLPSSAIAASHALALPPTDVIPGTVWPPPPPVSYHQQAHLPSIKKKQPVRAGIAGAAIAFLIVAILSAVAARGHMKSAAADPPPSTPSSSQ